jgi:MSHA biogenesis protein MshP
MRSTKQSPGFTLIGAIFLLVVLSTAGVFMVNLSGVQRATTNAAFMGARAYQAAYAGVEWAVYEAENDPSTCPAAAFSLTEGGLNGFDLTVTCSMADHVENLTTTTVFRITSQAEYGAFGDPDYVSRRVEAGLMVNP